MITIRNLYGGYDKHQILHGVDFEANAGITVVIGANGSGKSTLLRSIVGLCQVYSGDVLYENRDITKVPTYKLSEMGISYMAQRNNVFAQLSVYENLVMAAHPRKPDLAYAFEIFPMLEQYRKTQAALLSGGQRQLLAMAMMIQKRPKVCMFDEPTAALSPKNSKIVLDKIQHIQESLSNCTIIVEQNVRAALAIADTTTLLASGEVKFAGEPDVLLKDDALGAKYLGLGH